MEILDLWGEGVSKVRKGKYTNLSDTKHLFFLTCSDGALVITGSKLQNFLRGGYGYFGRKAIK